MRFALPEEAVAIGAALRQTLDRACPPATVRAAWEDDGSGGAPWRALWATLGELGLPGLLVPERAGGFGGDELTLVAAMEEIGYAAAPGPLAETVAVGAPLLAASDIDGWEALLAGAAETACAALTPTGRAAGADTVLLVPYAGASSHLVLLDEGRARFAMRAEVAPEALEAVDRSRRAALVRCAAGTPLEVSEVEVRRARARVTLAVAAELVGLTTRMLEITVAYVSERHQFGVPIGSFQALKHRLADALVEIEFTRPAVQRAAASLARGDTTAGCHVSMAKAMASRAAARVARAAIQCHGAMGYTVEYDLHLFVKRAWARAADWGSTQEHLHQVARGIGLD